MDAPSSNLHSFLTNLAPCLTAGAWLCVGSPDDEGVFARLTEHLRVSGAQPESLLRRAGDEPRPESAVALLLLGPSIPVEVAATWLGHLPALGNPVIIGCAELPAGGADLLLEQPLTSLRLTFASGFWYGCRSPFLLPDAYPCTIPVSSIPIHLTCASDGLGVLHDRDDFLRISEKSVACRYHEGGGQIFPNAIPDNYASVEAMTADVGFIGGYRPLDVGEGSSAVFLRNVSVAGRIGLLYDKDNGVIDESFVHGKVFTAPYRDMLPDHDHFIKVCSFSMGDASTPHLGTHRATFSTHIDRPVVVTLAWDIWNYNHWVHYLLSRFWYLDRFPELRRLPVVIGALSRRFHHEYLSLLGLSDLNFVEYHQSATLHLSRAYLPSLIDPPQHSPGCRAWLRAKLLSKAAALPAGYESGLYYISRGDAAGRRIVDEERILTLVRKSGFKIIQFSHFSVAEQIALMCNARAVIGPHGSSLTNLVFAPPGCAVLDLLPTREIMAQQKSGALGMEIVSSITADGGAYFMLLAQGVTDVGNTQSDYAYDFGEFESAFAQLMAKVGK